MTQFSTRRCTTGCVAEQMFSVGSISRASSTWPFFSSQLCAMNCEISPASALSCRSAEEREKNAVTMTRWQLQHYHVTILWNWPVLLFWCLCKRMATDCRRIRMIVWLANAGRHEFTVHPSNALFCCSQFEFQIPLTPTTDLPLYSVRARVQIEYTQ